jgi:hypothetical protein
MPIKYDNFGADYYGAVLKKVLELAVLHDKIDPKVIREKYQPGCAMKTVRSICRYHQ